MYIPLYILACEYGWGEQGYLLRKRAPHALPSLGLERSVGRWWYPHLGRVADSGSQGLEVIGVRTSTRLTPVVVVLWILEVSIEGEPYE